MQQRTRFPSLNRPQHLRQPSGASFGFGCVFFGLVWLWVFFCSFWGLFVCFVGVLFWLLFDFLFFFSFFFFSSQKALAPSMPFIQLQLCSPGLSPLTGSLHLESSLSFFSLWSYKAEGRIMYGLIPYRGTLVWVKKSSSMPSFPACF